MRVLIVWVVLMFAGVAWAQESPPAETLRILPEAEQAGAEGDPPAPPHGSGGPQELLVQGNTFYEEERYEEALAAYQRAASYGVENEVLHYNLGNTFFRLGRLGPAVLEYERALLLTPGDPDVRANLEFARAHATDVAPPQPEGPVAMAASWLRRPGINSSAIFALLAYLVGATLLGLVLAGRRVAGPIALRLGILALLLAVPPALVVGLQGSARELDARAVVLAERVECRSGPGTTNPVLFTVHEAATVEIVDERGGWARISLPDGLNGWLPIETFERIKPRY